MLTQSLKNGREWLPKAYLGLMMFMLVWLFWLNHSNQSSSQTLATFFLLLSPGLLLFRQPTVPFGQKLFITSCIAMFIYSLLLFFHYPPSEVAFSTMRGLSFYLLAPVSILLLTKISPSLSGFFLLSLVATLFSLFPVLKEFLSYGMSIRGDSSAHPIFWGNVCLTTGIVTFVLSRSYKLNIRFKTTLGLIALCAATTASLWSLTRGGWLSIPFALFLLSTLGLIQKRSVVILGILLTITFSLSNRLQDRVTSTFNHFAQGFSLDGSTSVRIQMWAVSLDALQESPVIGAGLDGFSRQNIVEKERGNVSFYVDHAHNEYFEILASRGLLGMSIFLLMIGSLASTYYKYRHSIYAKAGLIALMQYLIYSLSETFFTTKFTIMYFVVLHSFLLVAMYKEQQNQAQEPRVTAV
ncbi:O-antigen ligase family protein [Bacterioplanoides sp.]|uniref:O-antigen ligase family protein n=1 Tax=Bacterioplanoides sp. TaxID=2066072 RepID=UPI003B5A166C